MSVAEAGVSDLRTINEGMEDYAEAAATRARLFPNVVDCFIAAMVDEGWRVSHIARHSELVPDPDKPGKYKAIKLPFEEWGWLSKRLNMMVGYPRLREWAKGRRPVPDEVVKVMYEKAIPWILKEVKLSVNDLPDSIVHKLFYRAYPWAADWKLPVSRKVSKLSEKEETWLLAALLPPKSNKKAKDKVARKGAPRKVTGKAGGKIASKQETEAVA